MPFDVNQRDTCFYGTDSQGDWERLGEEIEKRLRKAVSGEKPVRKEKGSVTEDSDSDQSEFGEAELAMLRIFYYDSESDQSLREESRLKNRMRELGFSQSDITDAFNKLELEEMIHFSGATEMACYYVLTRKGMIWCLDNKEALRKSS